MQDEALERGIWLFRYLADRANKGASLGVGYAQFLAWVHGERTFREYAGRPYAQSDTGYALSLAHRVTDATGRISVSRDGSVIAAGMDSFIWQSALPHDRSLRAWKPQTRRPPYTREEWLRVFPHQKRRLLSVSELATWPIPQGLPLFD